MRFQTQIQASNSNRPAPQLQRPGVESALVAAEAAAALQGTQYWGHGFVARGALEVQREVQRELDYLLVQVGGLFNMNNRILACGGKAWPVQCEAAAAALGRRAGNRWQPEARPQRCPAPEPLL